MSPYTMKEKQEAVQEQNRIIKEMKLETKKVLLPPRSYLFLFAFGFLLIIFRFFI